MRYPKISVCPRLDLALIVLVLPVAAAAQVAAPSAVSASAPPTGLWERETLTGDWSGVRLRLEAAGVTLGLQEQSEVWSNMAGGLKRGVTYDGLTTASVKLNLEKLIGWPGATFFVNAYQIHGRGPSANLAGNIQFVSNIEATPDTKLYQMWLEQSLLNGQLTIRLGQEGANDQMMTTKYGALFLNSSFGYPGLPDVDLPTGGPNYPMATPFARVEYQATEHITLVGAAFNGDPAPAGPGDPQLRDKGGTAFRLNDHLLAFAELWYSINQEKNASGLPATYKIGMWYDTSRFADQLFDTNGVSLASPANNGIPRSHSPGYALYGIIDQMVWKKPGTKDQGIGLFIQVMGAPDRFNISDVFIEAGANWRGPFDGRENDIVGIGVSYLGIGSSLRRFGRDVRSFAGGTGSLYSTNETVVEATYLYQVAPWWTLQPDLQVVINPGANIPSAGSSKPLKDAVIGGLHVIITF